MADQYRELLRIFGSGRTIFNPAQVPSVYYWGETRNLALANNAVVASVPDESAAGHNLLTIGSPVYKTGILNGYGVVQTVGGSSYLYHPAAQIPAQTIIFVKKCLAVVDTNDVLSHNAVATRVRMANPGYDWFANSASGVVAVGGTTLTSWDTITIRVAANPGPMIIRVNGVQKASFNPHLNWYSNNILKIFPSMTGQFAAMGRFSSDIGDIQASQIEEYLRQTYGHY